MLKTKNGILPLSTEQQTAFNAIEQNSNNFLILGEAGAGKSHLIKHLQTYGKKKYHIVAPSAIAAQLIGGKTIHRQFNIPILDFIEPLQKTQHTNSLKGINHLIIDEISMLRADILDYIDRQLQNYCKTNIPFGGIQIIFVGDFYQLPPVCKFQTKSKFAEYGYKSEFAFHAKCFFENNLKVINLREIHRQSDAEFLGFLNRARNARLTNSDVSYINGQLHNAFPNGITITSTNKEADEINTKNYQAITNEEFEFFGETTGTFPNDEKVCEDIIKLKVGCKVMVLKNYADNVADSPIVNGYISFVKKIFDDRIELECGNTVYVQVFKKYENQYNEQEKNYKPKLIGTFQQLPIKHAWAISIHKSQGQTFENVNIDLKKVFADGQAYVALSRAKSKEGINLLSPISAKSFKTNTNVMNFYNFINEHGDMIKYKDEKPFVNCLTGVG